MKNNTPTILIIFGISGDLARRYLVPAIEFLRATPLLPEKFEIVGITRQENSNLYQMDLESPEAYEKLDRHLASVEKSFGAPAQRLFYFSVPPAASRSIIELIGRSGLIRHTHTKILLEKPFGTDLESAREFAQQIDVYFEPSQVYRVDHYLAKETVKEMINIRTHNAYYKIWNKDHIESIEITASEKIGIEGRADFYEHMGALRDFVQNHLLELAAVTLMGMPENSKAIPALRAKALKNLSIVCNVMENDCVKRAQYEGYTEEVGNAASRTETFVSLHLASSDPLWQGVPITLTTGKELKEKFTTIILRRKSGENIEFDFKDRAGSVGAYGRVILSAIEGDQAAFISKEEAIEAWRILGPVQEYWKNSKNPLILYKKGSSVEDVVKLF